jgi:hypothetical protein
MVAQIHKEKRKAPRADMAPNQGARRTEVEQDLEPDVVIAALEIVKVEVPIPEGARHGTNGVAALMEGDGTGLEYQLVAGGQQPSS